MKKRDKAYYQKIGALEVYIQLLLTGIREICIPNYGEARKEDLGYIDIEARKHGFRTMLITFDCVRPDDGSKFNSYSRIIFVGKRRSDARILKMKMQKKPKEKSDHEAIGRLLGYSEEAISAFVTK